MQQEEQEEEQHYRSHPPADIAKHLGVAQEASEVDVEHVAAALHHDVVIVPVTDSQHVGGHAAACT